MQVKNNRPKLVKFATIDVREIPLTAPMRGAKVVTGKGRERQGIEKPRKMRSLEDHPAVGIWKDREDMKDVDAWVKKIRAPRYLGDGGTLFSPPRQKSRLKPKS